MVRLTHERIERVKAAFTKAADADIATRNYIIAEMEREDVEAANILRCLLSTHDDTSDDLFEEPVICLDEVLSVQLSTTVNAPSLGNRYRIIRLLGCGGVGDVYLAEESTPIQRKVAIKVFRPHRLEEQRLRRFGIEARALGTLAHPGIAQVFGAGEAADGRPYLTMEYVPGLPIDEACEVAKLDEYSILRVFVDLCDATQHAHQRGIIHRDLKPSNVLVVRTGDAFHVKIIDFGVAKLADEAGADFGSLTLHGQTVGTLDFMSPEQWQGAGADTRSDVYSLGVILYRLLTHRMPFSQRFGLASRSPAEHRVPEPMREVPKWMRRDMETILSKALAHDPARRFASPLHMAEDLSRLLRGEPVQARQTSLGERIVKGLRRHPRVALLSGMVLSVIVVLATYIAVSRQRLAEEVEVQRAMIGGLLDEVLDRLYVLTGAMDTREALATSLLARTDELLHGIGRAVPRYQEAERIFAHLTANPHADVHTSRRYVEAIVRHAHSMGLTESFARNRFAHEILERLAEHHPTDSGVLDDLCWSYDRLAFFWRKSATNVNCLAYFRVGWHCRMHFWTWTTHVHYRTSICFVRITSLHHTTLTSAMPTCYCTTLARPSLTVSVSSQTNLGAFITVFSLCASSFYKRASPWSMGTTTLHAGHSVGLIPNRSKSILPIRTISMESERARGTTLNTLALRGRSQNQTKHRRCTEKRLSSYASIFV